MGTKLYEIMKKTIYLASCLTVLSLFTACKKEEIKPTPTPTPTPTTNPTDNGGGSNAVINYTPEQNKANLQQSGLDAMKEMDDAKNMRVIDNLIQFSKLIDQNDPIDNNNTQGLMPIIMVNSLIKFKETSNPEVVYSAMRHTKKLSEADNVEALFDEIKGIYTWNASEKKWNKTTSNSLIFKFPAFKDNIGNNATYTIDYTPYKGTVANKELEGNIPSKLTAKLDIDNTNYLAFEFNASYDADGLPTSIASNLKVENFNFNVEMSASSSDLSSKFSFTHSGKNIVSMGCAFKGNFAKANLESLENLVETTDIKDENGNVIGQSQTTKITEDDIKKVVTSMSGYLQVYNVKLETSADIEAFVNEIKAKGGFDNIKDEKDQLNLINKYLLTSVFYTDRNAKIGHGELYMKTYTDTYTEWVNGVAVNKTETHEDAGVRIVFEDGSKIDLETYFESGFDKIQNEFENFLNSMENNYDL